MSEILLDLCSIKLYFPHYDGIEKKEILDNGPNMTGFVLIMTGVFINMTGFVLNMSQL